MFRMLTAATLLGLLATTAQAGTVYFGDLDTKSPAGAKVLAGRVDAAARDACSTWQPEASHSLFYRSTYETCIQSTGRETMNKVMAAAGHADRLASK